MTDRQIVVAAMSGGVDSSVAAGLLKQAGYKVVGATLRLKPCGEDNGEVSWCCGRGAEEQSRAVCGVLGIPHYVVDAAEAFEEAVLRPAWLEYDRGRTPSPCVVCNEKIKLRLLLDLARKLGADKVATGHYARVERHSESGLPVLRRGVDRRKDQSYFLFTLTREQLGAVLFPLGTRTKPEIREIARGLGFPNAERAESQDACFVVKEADGFAEALRRRFGGVPRTGDIVDPEGEVIGTHGGIHRYTVGQRRGLGVALGRRAYVSRIDAERDEVVLTDDPGHLESATLTASPLIWTGGVPAKLPLRCDAQIRYRHAPQAALAEEAPGGGLKLTFDSPERAVAPGQAVVLFDGNRVLGGGWIDGR
jgi:tRNA-uridine 2-sulfurtransferase